MVLTGIDEKDLLRLPAAIFLKLPLGFLCFGFNDTHYLACKECLDHKHCHIRIKAKVVAKTAGFKMQCHAHRRINFPKDWLLAECSSCHEDVQCWPSEDYQDLSEQERCRHLKSNLYPHLHTSQV